MTYRVELTRRAIRQLDRLYEQIDAIDSDHARAWYQALEAAILSLEENPGRCAATPEDRRLRHLLHGHGRNVYRVIFRIDARRALVTVLQVRHSARRPLRR